MNTSVEATAAPVGALYDSLSPNTGDRAIGLAVSQELARHGVSPTRILPPFGDLDATTQLCVVGGGELLRPVGDTFYDRFRLTGPAVLNAVGVWPEASHLDYLRDYQYVTARSTREVDVLRAFVPNAELVPCTTTTMEGEPYDIDGLVQDGEPVVGIHVVPHTLELCPELVEVVNSIPHRKVLIPFTHYNHDDTFMRALPFDRSRMIELPKLTPGQLHTVIGQMTYVVVSSLHATIFALSQGVPFATARQNKIVNYLEDRDLEDFIFGSTRELEDVVRRLEEAPPDLTAVVERDRAAVHDSFATIARLVGAAAPEPVTPELIPPDGPTPREAITLLAHQREDAIIGRDSVLATVARRASRHLAETIDLHGQLGREQARAHSLEAELQRLRDENQALRTELQALRDRWDRSIEGRLRRTGRAVRKLLPGGVR